MRTLQRPGAPAHVLGSSACGWLDMEPVGEGVASDVKREARLSVRKRMDSQPIGSMKSSDPPG